jgi:hypothetical protein
VPILWHLDFMQNEITNIEASGAYVVCVITCHRMLMFCQLDDSGILGSFFRVVLEPKGFVLDLGGQLSHPGSRKQNRSLHTCAQDVQITRTANNMVNRYNISLNYKLESLQNDPWVHKKYYRVARKSKRRCVFHRHNRRRGRPSLYLLAPAGTLG